MSKKIKEEAIFIEDDPLLVYSGLSIIKSSIENPPVLFVNPITREFYVLERFDLGGTYMLKKLNHNPKVEENKAG